MQINSIHILGLQSETPTATPTATATPTITPSPTPTPNYQAIYPIVITQGSGGNHLVHIRNVNPQQPLGILTQFYPISKKFIDSNGGGSGRSTYFSKGDLNEDGIPDMVFSFGPVISEATYPNMVVPYDIVSRNLIGHPFMAFPKGDGHPVRYNGGEIRTAVGNFLEEGKKLIAAAQGEGSQLGLVRLFEYTGLDAPNGWKIKMQFQPLDDVPTRNNANGGVILAAGDLDQDGLDELVVGQTNSDTSLTQLTVIDIDPNGQNHIRHNFTAFPNAYVGLGGFEMVIADVNGDGKCEIVVANKRKPKDKIGTVIGLIVPVVNNGKIDGFLRPNFRLVRFELNKSNYDYGNINLGKGEFDGYPSNGEEIIIGSAKGASQSFYQMLKIRFDSAITTNGYISGVNFLNGEETIVYIPQYALIYKPLFAFYNKYNPASGEVFVNGIDLN